MNNKEKDILQKCHFSLVKHLDCSSQFLAHLYQNSVITEQTLHKLERIRSGCKRRRKLLESLRSRSCQGYSPLERFIEILDDTGQGVLAQGLRRGYFEEDEKRRQEAEWKLQLKKCYILLMEDLIVDDSLVSFYYQEELLSTENNEKLSFLHNPEKRSNLLKIVRTKPCFFKPGVTVRDVFLKGLELHRQQHLIEAINETKITQEEYEQYEDEEYKVHVEEMLLQDFKHEEGSSVALSLVQKCLQHRHKEINKWFNMTNTDIIESVKWAFDGVIVGKEEKSSGSKAKKIIKHLKCVNEEAFVKTEEEEGESSEDVPMVEWSCEQVAEWARQVVVEATVKIMIENEIDGKQLVHCTVDDLLKIISSRNRCGVIIEERDEVLDAERNKSIQNVPKRVAAVQRDDGEESLIENFRDFDTAVTLTEKYQRFWKFRESESRTSNQLDPVRKYVHYQEFSLQGKTGTSFFQDVVQFAAACLNERTNGVLYVGVKDREVLGVSLGDLSMIESIERTLLQNIKKSFSDDQIDCVLRCIRPVKYIEVVPREDLCAYVLEIEIVPESDLCGDDIFLVRAPCFFRNQTVHEDLSLYKFGDVGPKVEPNITTFLRILPKLVKSRKAKEAQQSRKKRIAFPPNLSKKLKHALCQGQSTLKGDRYPLLVIPPVDDIVDEDYAVENFSFLKDINWRVVFDFGSDGTLCKFMQSEEFRVRYAEDFDPNYEINRSSSSRLENLKAEFLGPQPLWLFANGHDDAGKSCMSKTEWKKNRWMGIVEFINFFKGCLSSDRVTIMFLLLSKQYEVMLEVADILCTSYPDQYVCIAEDESVSKPWVENLLSRQSAEKESLDNRMVVPLPWEQVREVVREIAGKEPVGQLELPTVHGTNIPLPDRIKNQMYDLEIVGTNHCSSCIIVKDKEKLKELKRDMEERFYRGAKVDWWNFWFKNQVLKREAHEELREMLSKCLNGDLPEEDLIGSVTLYHQPGCGGTTIARNILWDLKGAYRCAEVTNVTENTCEQILKLRSFGEALKVQPKPLLVVLDNVDVDQVKNLMAQMREKARIICRQGGLEIKVFCVFLMVVRTSDLPKKSDAKLSSFVEQKLSDSERNWFADKYNSLESDKEIDPETLIAFNILKENFSKDYINRTVENYVREIRNSKEKLLLKFLALLNVYDVDKRPIPLSAFDSFMLEPLWECSLSTEIDLLVNVNAGQCHELGLRTISIFHPLIASAVLSILREMDGERQMLSEFTLSCFNNHFVRSRGSMASKMLLDRISATLKHRDRFFENREKFSPIIQQIINDENIHKAVEVLKKGFEITEDAFLAQQIARVYIEAKLWDSALEYAQKAISLIENNTHLYDTLGQVHRRRLEEWHNHLKGKIKENDVDADVLTAVKMAYDAIRIYKTEQRLEKRPNLPSSVAGFRGALSVCTQLLDCLSLHSTFKGLSRCEKKSDDWYYFFTDREYVPASVGEWSDIDGTDYIEFLKSIKDECYMYIKLLEDESTQVKERYVDEHREKQSSAFYHQLTTKLKQRVDTHFALSSDDIPENASPAQRQQIIRAHMYSLGGTSFKSIIRCGQINKLRGLSLLRTIVHDILLRERLVPEDLQYYIGVCLAIKCLHPESDLAKSLSFEDLVQKSRKLYSLRSVNSSHMEPYLYFLMFNWPLSNSATAASHVEITKALNLWAQAFVDKYPQQKLEGKPQYKKTILTVFYITNSTGLSSFAYSRLLHVSSESGDKFWKTSPARTQLKRFYGTLVDEGEHVSIQVQYHAVARERLKIPTSYPITNSMQWNKPVSFVIGFTWMGPKAFDVQDDVEGDC